MAEKLKVVFAGTPDFAVPSLERLLEDSEIEVVAVFTQPDRPAGRGQELSAPPVKKVAEEKGIPLFQPEKLEASELQKFSPDFLVVVAYGVILADDVLSLPKFGCINLHASLLPKFRGASPIQSAILSSEDKTGVSFMRITEKLDSGPVYTQFKVEIAEKNAEELGTELAALGGEKFPEVLKMLAAGELKETPQDDAQASECKKIEKADGKVNWEKDSAETLLKKLRAFTPWPGVWTEIGGKNLKLVDFETWNVEHETQKDGETFERAGKIGVQSADGAIQLIKVQLEGKKALDVQEFVKGNADFVGAKLG
ncbi:MAG: methionyl-tRNA formyltransferase [Patescibacteria group bacterium]